MQKNLTKRLCVIAVLIAMQIVLGRLASINVGSYLKIGFGFIPIAVCGILTGPVWTLLMASICDILGALLFPSGAFYWGFTLVAAIGGLIYGLFLHNHKPNLIRCLICTFIIAVICNIILHLNTRHTYNYLAKPSICDCFLCCTGAVLILLREKHFAR